jgi:hypothetical protein
MVPEIKTIKEELKNCLRTNETYLRIKTGKHVAVFNRVLCSGADAFDFIEQVDTIMNNGKILRNDKTCYVSRIVWNGKDMVIRRYNHKGLFHSLICTIRKPGACRAWLNAHRLEMLDIATPRPLAYIEQRNGILIWKSYFINEFIEGRKISHLIQEDTVGYSMSL